jgi:hypothetical protein
MADFGAKRWLATNTPNLPNGLLQVGSGGKHCI